MIKQFISRVLLTLSVTLDIVCSLLESIAIGLFDYKEGKRMVKEIIPDWVDDLLFIWCGK